MPIKRILSLCFILFWSWATWAFLRDGGHSGITFPHVDKVAHFGIFLILTLLMDRVFTPHAVVTFAVMLVYGSGIELIQGQLPHREASFADLVADMVGVVVYFVLLKQTVKTKLEQLSQS